MGILIRTDCADLKIRNLFRLYPIYNHDDSYCDDQSHNDYDDGRSEDELGVDRAIYLSSWNLIKGNIY